MLDPGEEGSPLITNILRIVIFFSLPIYFNLSLKVYQL